MTEKILIAKEFIKYQLKAKNRHGIHSAYVLNLYHEVIASKKYYYAFDKIETLRENLLHNNKKIEVTDLGAGSKVDNQPSRKISSIAKNALSNVKTGQMLFRLVEFLKPENVLELGTSLGVNTLYLASANENTQVTTLEGCPQTMDIAKKNFQSFKVKNIKPITGNIDQTLQIALNKIKKADMVFFDANHQKKPTLQYFELCLDHANENSVFIFDDIYWSTGMMAAWEEIKVHKKVVFSLDLFDLGLVFFNKSHPKKHFLLKF